MLWYDARIWYIVLYRIQSTEQGESVDKDSLFDIALQAAQTSYSPYSHFRVGAALECSDGSVITGTNIENRSFGLTICAERNAIAHAVHIGQRTIVALAVATPDSDSPVSPCGACRQVLTEFCEGSISVQFGPSSENRVFTTLGELFPHDSLHGLGGSPQRFS